MLAATSAIARGAIRTNVVRRGAKSVKPSNSVVRHASKKVIPEYSPHVTIYAFPFPAIASISNRVAGVGLAAGFWAAGAASLVCPTAVPVLFGFIKAYPALAALTKGVVAFPIAYHYICGIRHLVWDNTNWGIESVEAVELSSKVVIGATAAITVGAMML